MRDLFMRSLFNIIIMKIRLPDNLTVWQKDLINEIGDNFRNQDNFIVVSAPRQCFKSSTIALVMIKASLTLVGDSVYIAPTLQQSRSQMQDIVKLLDGSGAIKQVNYQTLELTFANGSRIYFRSGQQKDSLRGLTAENLMVLDECSFLEDDFILTALPLRRVTKALTICISSPLTAEGFFWNAFNNPSNRVFDWSKYVNLIYTKNELENLKKMYSTSRFQTEILGKFIPKGQGLLFNNIIDCLGSSTNRDGLVVGVDCSSAENGDYTAVTVVNRDYEVVDVFYNNTLKPVERINWIADIVNRYKPTKVIVEKNSIGDTFIDLLKRLTNIPITGWVTSNKSKRDMIEHLQYLFEQKIIKIPNNQELIKELQSFQAVVKNKIITYSGKNCKDDCVLSLAISCFAIKSNLGSYHISLV